MYAGDEIYGDVEPYEDDLMAFRERELDEDAAAGEFDPDPEPTPEEQAEHEAHSARGENHWFTCYQCDDESDDA